MENISHSLPKRSFSSNPNAAFSSHKSVYDDVFGGPPKFGLPTLAPRLEDYSEIFGGFHSSRSSSIPVLELPLIGHEPDLHFDVRSSGFDYNEVFGEFGGLDFTASFEDLFGQSSGGGYDSSDDPWSPAQSGSLSDELDPLGGSDKSHRLSDGDVHQSSQSIKQFNSSYNKSSKRSMETMLAATHHVTNFSAIPGYTFSHYESPVSWDGEDEHCSMGVVDDINHSKEGGVREDNQYKCSPNPLHSGFDIHRNDCNTLEKRGNSTSPRDKPFVTVSDISLRTKPSRLPPPSRPPPVLAVKKGEGDISNSKLKASKSYAFERVADDCPPLFFDVEIDAAVSAEDRGNGNKNLKVKHQSTTEPVERKHTRSYSAMQVEEKTRKTDGVCNAIEDEDLLQSDGDDTTIPIVQERIETTNISEATSGSPEVQCNSHSAEDSVGAVAWREATEYFEVIEENISRQGFDIVNDDLWRQHMNRDVHIHQQETEHAALNLKEGFKEFKVTKEARCHERNHPEMNKEQCECGNKQQKDIPHTWMSDQKGSPDKQIPNKGDCTGDVNKKIPKNLLQLGEFKELQIDTAEALKLQTEAVGNVNQVAAKLKLKGSPKRMNIEKRFVVPQITKQNSGKHKQNILREEFQKRIEDVEEAETNKEVVKERTDPEVTEKRHTGASAEQNENKLEEVDVLKENTVILKEGKEHRESSEKSYVADGHDKSEDEHLGCEKDMDSGNLRVNELTFKETLIQFGDDNKLKFTHDRDVIKERNGGAPKTGDNISTFRTSESEAGNKEETSEKIGNMISRDAGLQGQLSGPPEEHWPIERNGNGREVERGLDGYVLLEGDQLKASEGGSNVDGFIAAKVSGEHDIMQMEETQQVAFSSEGNGELKTEPQGSTYESESRIDDTLAKGRFDQSGMNIDEVPDENSHHATNKTVESPCLPNQTSDSNIGGTGIGISRVMPSAKEDGHEPVKIVSSGEHAVQKMKNAQFVGKRTDIRDNVNPSHVIRESVINERKVENASSFLKHDDLLFSVKNATGQRIERRELYMKDNLASKDQKVGERIRRETAEENEHMRKLEEEWEREREREKDRMAVDKAALEARERSYSEARERSNRERAAVERTTLEARQRAMAEARERLEKASMEARLRAERAAVERATAEARQRAAEKLMAHRAAYVPRDLERSVPDRFSASFRSAETRQGYLSSDLHYQSTGISNGLRSYSLAHDGAEGESPQRCKARLERYRRTAERAANALAEKNRRDLLAQREREERNRVAEALDAEVRRWSSGKEGNLRALLSTLQYILGPDSGWHPIPLTEVITSAAVKRAYRKATLCIHPDKLQQRGATVQQKYICEKVFDLLKEAWNKFNSEER